MYSCKMCASTYKRKCHLMRHERVHKGIRYSCTMCMLVYNYRSNLIRHMKIAHGFVDIPNYQRRKSEQFENEGTSPATVLYRLQSKQPSPDDKTLSDSSLLRQHIHDTSYGGIAMSSENSQSVSSPRSSIAANVKPTMEHMDGEVQRTLINNLDDMLLQQARPTGQEEYVRPSVIVWGKKEIRRQKTFAQDTGAANRNAGTYF